MPPWPLETSQRVPDSLGSELTRREPWTLRWAAQIPLQGGRADAQPNSRQPGTAESYPPRRPPWGRWGLPETESRPYFPSVHLPPSLPCPQSHPRILPRPPPAHCVRPRDPALEDNPSEPCCGQSELEGSCQTRPTVRWGSRLADAIDLCAGQSMQASKWINPRKHSSAEHIARIGFLHLFVVVV